MTLAAGTRLGPYEVIAPVGAGGMGEVYRARDTRLDRDVAIKVLPESIAAREDVRARFEREAKAISALNHPNICTLYDVGREGDVEYLVMELLDGETLASVLSRGKLPLDRAIRHAIEISTALDRAHRQGIVHRDLKPGNVMITKGGGVKLLDFGLARPAAPLGRHDATTFVNPITEEGMVLGTLEYMSPEQLEGKPTDARTDLFSFGCILYEMITGRRAFGGGSSASLITAIMSSDPPPIATFSPVTPPALERLVRKCLEKNPDDRWQNAGDLAIELKWINDSPEQAAPARKQRRGVILFLGFVAAVFAFWGSFVAWRLGKRNVAHPPLMRFTIPLGTTMLGSDLLGATIAISPDGRSLVYVARGKGANVLWRRTLSEATPVAIEKTEGAAQPFWSPDSQQIAFAARGKLVRIPAHGGDVTTICDVSPGAQISATWNGDGTIIFGELAGRSGLFRVPAAGGTPQNIPIPSRPPNHPAIAPQLFDKGRKLAYCTVGVGSDLHLHVFSFGSGEDRDLGQIDSQVQLVDDAMFYVRDGSLYVVRVDTDLRRIGEPALVASDVGYYVSLGSGYYRASRDAIVFTSASYDAHLTWFSRRGEILGTTGPDGANSRARISSDGRKAVTRIIDPQLGTGDLWTLDLSRNVSTRLTNSKFSEGTPTISRDGKTIAFSSDLGGPPHVFTMPASGGAATEITRINKLQYVNDWMPDGRRLLLSVLDPATKLDIVICDAQPGAQPVPWLATPFDERGARISHDGKLLAYTSDASGRREAYAAPFDAPADAIQISNGGATDLAWSPGGDELFYATDDGRMYAVKLRTPPAFDAAPPELLFHDDIGEWRDFDVAPDGRFLIGRTLAGPLTRPLNVIVNWRRLL